ncbi:hypothetical protein PYW07_012192 [Mythimna separata]|uniref:Uncharacterized protein n=1 Tax=Mythimna separata TaxID=271217 RepID=A0AAD8DTI8_MYTSE|nr:hypothetical protein PYW07_012192 [Mythimna separata]
MGIPIWCYIAPLFLVPVKAGIHDVVAQSFYEEPPSSSPAPTVPTQSHQPDLTGMKEVVLFLTPDQVQTLQAAGAVVQPYPEYENDFIDLQEQLRQSVEQPNVQQYQTWMSPVEVQKDNPDVLNYFKLLNIQEINDDLSHNKTPPTEATTEMTTTTPRYKYTKARPHNKEKEYSTYVPKKASRPKINNQSNNAEAYVRFLPHYEHEILQMVPYQALPLSPYQFAQIEANAYIQANEKAQQIAQSQANIMAQQAAFNVKNEKTQQSAFSAVNSAVQQNPFNLANTEAQQSAFDVASKQPVQQTAFHLTNTVAPQYAYVTNTEAPQNVFVQRAQQNAYNNKVNNTVSKSAKTVAHTETQRNVYPQANVAAQQTANTETQQAAYYKVNTAQETAKTDANPEVQQNVYSQSNVVFQQTSNTVPNTEVPQTTYSQANKISYNTANTVANTETRPNAYTEASTKSQENAYTESSTKAQQIAYTEPSAKDQQNSHTRPNKESQRNVYKPTRPPRLQAPKGTKKLQGLEKVPASVVTPKPRDKTYFVSQGSKDFKETLSSIEGLPPLLPLTPAPPLEGQQEKPAAPAPPLPTVQTSILQKDRFSLLLAPLYQHQTITDTISRQKEELVKEEYNIRTKLQKMKESPQYYDQREYTIELEKLTKNLGQQNDLARIEASTVPPTAYVTQEPVYTESQPIELVRSTETPTIVHIPKTHDVNIPAPYPTPLEYTQAFRVSNPVAGGIRPVEGVRNVYVKVDRPYTIQKFAPFTEKQKIPVINSEHFKIIRHIWEH